ncbi:MAG: chemotaxis protein CheR [Halochromatium sp.]|nr:chemotaxis protein CheR [Halochromatium sp.]
MPEHPIDEEGAADDPAPSEPTAPAESIAGASARDRPGSEIPVVGIGASAGGLKAFRQLLANLGSNTGMAFVLIQHLDPTHESLLPELLQADSSMPVHAVRDGILLEANSVYVIAPGQQLHLLHNRLQSIGDAEGRPFHPLDTFFRSLAQDRGSKAIGVILSGTASDGTLGSRAIKEAGGITFAQDLDSAEYPSMPANAVAAGYIDFVLPPEKIARELIWLAQHSYLLRASFSAHEPMLPLSLEELNKILILLRARTGHDFSYYKDTTIRRRIARRVLLHKLDSSEHYIRLLQRDANEVDALLQDILINVTGFFRDPDGFAALQRIAFPALLQNRPADAPLRIWVPGCSSGQEVYSIAIALNESIGNRAQLPPVQFFGSDIDDDAIETARRGVYPPSIEDEVAPARLKHWFRKVSGGYQISTMLRESCVFAVQSVIRDPSFSKLDLISCRNLMIYFELVLQKKVFGLFHYALQPEGFLLLGASESIGAQSELFALKDKAGKLYQKKSASPRTLVEPGFRLDHKAPLRELSRAASLGPSVYDLDRVAEQRLIERYAPVGVIVGPDQQVLRFLGRSWPYIEHPAGTATLNLYKVLHPDLLLEVRAAVREATASGQDVCKQGIKLHVEGALRRVSIQVLALGGAIRSETNLMVLFEPSSAPPVAAQPRVETAAAANSGAAADGDANVPEDEPAEAPQLQARITEQERELAETREYMQSIIEQQEGLNEELRSANEEVQSTNEELQSTNEELETAKEELQSTNEELATVNVELENRNEDLAVSNNDLTNLLNSINLPILILGADLAIRQFTRPAERLLNLIDSDIGRPIGNIKPNIELPELERVVLEVIETMTVNEFELTDDQGRWYSVRVRPYRTLDNRIDGAILLFVDIDDVKRVQRLEADLEEQRRLAAVVRDANDAVTVQDLRGIIQTWNPAAERIYGYSEQEALGMDVRSLVAPEHRDAVDGLLREIAQGRSPAPIELERIGKDGRRLRVLLTTSVLVDDAARPVAVATTERLLDAPATDADGPVRESAPKGD